MILKILDLFLKISMIKMIVFKVNKSQYVDTFFIVQYLNLVCSMYIMYACPSIWQHVARVFRFEKYKLMTCTVFICPHGKWLVRDLVLVCSFISSWSILISYQSVCITSYVYCNKRSVRMLYFSFSFKSLLRITDKYTLFLTSNI